MIRHQALAFVRGEIGIAEGRQRVDVTAAAYPAEANLGQTPRQRRQVTGVLHGGGVADVDQAPVPRRIELAFQHGEVLPIDAQVELHDLRRPRGVDRLREALHPITAGDGEVKIATPHDRIEIRILLGIAVERAHHEHPLPAGAFHAATKTGERQRTGMAEQHVVGRGPNCGKAIPVVLSHGVASTQETRSKVARNGVRRRDAITMRVDEVHGHRVAPAGASAGRHAGRQASGLRTYTQCKIGRVGSERAQTQFGTHSPPIPNNDATMARRLP